MRAAPVREADPGGAAIAPSLPREEPPGGAPPTALLSPPRGKQRGFAAGLKTF
jgi:hypothetical protein